MSKYRKHRAGDELNSLLTFAKGFVGNQGSFSGYSLPDGGIDAGDEDRYELTLHVKQRMLEFYPGWSTNPVLIPLFSQRSLNLLQFLRETDAPTESGDRLIARLRVALKRINPAGSIHAITTRFRKMSL